MVKADVKRDYYADLELKVGADTEEIKKQFRKLGYSLADAVCCKILLTAYFFSSQVSS
jgi:hypothetical protein